MTKLIISLLSALLFALAPSAIAQTNYSKTTEFPALRISVSDLQDLLVKANSLIAAANASNIIKYRREEITISNGDLKITIPGHLFEVVGGKLPKIFDAFEYNLSVTDGVPISDLNLSFRDFSRTLTVRGNSPDQVDAVFSVLRDDIQRLSTSFGGSGQRIAIAVITLWVLSTALVVLSAVYIGARRKIILLPISLVGLLLFLFFALPLGDMLAGFIAVSGDASFMVRYGPQISFLGFVLTAVATIIALIPLFSGSIAKDKNGRVRDVEKLEQK